MGSRYDAVNHPPSGFLASRKGQVEVLTTWKFLHGGPTLRLTWTTGRGIEFPRRWRRFSAAEGAARSAWGWGVWWLLVGTATSLQGILLLWAVVGARPRSSRASRASLAHFRPRHEAFSSSPRKHNSKEGHWRRNCAFCNSREMEVTPHLQEDTHVQSHNQGLKHRRKQGGGLLHKRKCKVR